MKTTVITILSLALATTTLFAEPGNGPRGDFEDRRGKMVEQFDLDGNGELDEAERQAARDSQFERMALRRFDTNEDGELSETERAQAEAFREERHQKLLDRFDTDGDGQLNKEERQAARRAVHAQMGKGKGGERRGQSGERRGPPRSDEVSASGEPLPPPPGGSAIE